MEKEIKYTTLKELEGKFFGRKGTRSRKKYEEFVKKEIRKELKKKEEPIRLRAKVRGSNVIISKKDFFHILSCMATQKFINEMPPNGDAIAMGKKRYEEAQKQMQRVVDDCWNQGMKIIGEDVYPF